MNNINYAKLLRDVRCNECQYEGYNTDFEKQDVKIVEQTEFIIKYGIDNKMICPNCNVINSYKFVENE